MVHQEVEILSSSRDKQKQSLETYLNHRENSIRSHSKQKGITYSLPKGFLFQQFNNQNGMCFYTNIPMIKGKGVFTPYSIINVIQNLDIFPKILYYVFLL